MPPPPPPKSTRKLRASSRSRTRSKSPKSAEKLGPGPLFSKRPSELYCMTTNLDTQKGEQYNPEIHYSGKFKTDANGFVFDENGRFIENTLEEAIEARCGRFYTPKQIKRMIKRAKKESPSPKHGSLKLESLGGRRRRRTYRRK